MTQLTYHFFHPFPLQLTQLPEIRSWNVNSEGEVTGIVYGHGALADGDQILTSELSKPEMAADFSIVETSSGSKYRLGRRAPTSSARQAVENPAEAASEPVTKRKQQARPSFPNIFEGSLTNSKSRRKSLPLDDDNSGMGITGTATFPTQKKLPLTGKHLGNGKYLFAGPARVSTNGRCQISSAYHRPTTARTNDDKDLTKHHPDDELVIVKLSDNVEAMEREFKNFQKLLSGQQKGHIIKCHDYFKLEEKNEKKACLVLERGEEDLKQRRKRILGNGGSNNVIEDDELQAALLAAVKSLDTFHSSRLVWTDLKTENFVYVQGTSNVAENTQGAASLSAFKAIDLESARPVKGNPLDYTPEACPPEFARAFNAGDPHSFVLEYNYDIWSFGMMAYELATGHGFYDNNNPKGIMNRLAGNDIPDLKGDIETNIANSHLADLIVQCLDTDPKKRPSPQKILRHPYFKGSGGKNSFLGLSF